MNLKAQKIIAREILLLLGAIVVSGLIYGGLSLYSLYYEHQFRELSSKNYSIQSQMDSLQRVVSEDKWEKLSTPVSDNRPPIKLVGTPPLPKGLTSENERVTEVVSWKDLKREDSLNAVKLLKEDSINKALLKPLQLQHEQIEAAINVARQKYLEREDINYFTLIALCIIVIILYPVRGLYFVVRWAIRTLKQPANIK